MANPVFKNAALSAVGTTQQQLYVAPGSKTSIVIQLDVANIIGSAVTVDVYMIKGGNPYYLAKNAPIPVGGTLQTIYGQKQVLQTGDAIWVKSNTAASVDVIGSVTEDV
jgi:hypothetical protein